MVCFRLGLDHTGSEDSGRTLAFTTLIAGNVSLILVNRSWRRSVLATLLKRNVASWAVVAGATLTLLLAFWVPFLHRLFRFGPASADDLAIAAVAGVMSLAWFEVLKLFKTRWLQAA
jgi:Ca2+-transporting ATPase